MSGLQVVEWMVIICSAFTCICVTHTLALCLCRYYEEVFNASGCRELVEQFGPWFSLDMNPRAQIFRRNQSHVTDMDSMVRLMRYTPPFRGFNPNVSQEGHGQTCFYTRSFPCKRTHEHQCEVYRGMSKVFLKF